ncbi:MAG: peptide-methionine (S)-S-oxide reductase MsrA [Saprospiraceae bacterium]|nr:peptide-methionine (S)-S-oxide reductase MsrA [Saprospiraceae bacterium]
MKYLFIVTLFITLSSSQNCQVPPSQGESSKSEQKDLSKYHRAYFASGCFWCVEAVFESVTGVEEAISGYAGGESKNPTYETVSAGVTGHAEAVEVYYDTTIIDYPTLLQVFFGSHDPTTLNRQGPDAGTQYRSAIFFQNDQEKMLIEEYITGLRSSGAFDGPITTEVSPLDKFYPAEEYHQDYEMKNPNNPYVRAVSIPRLKKFQATHKDLLKAAGH